MTALMFNVSSIVHNSPTNTTRSYQIRRTHITMRWSSRLLALKDSTFFDRNGLLKNFSRKLQGQQFLTLLGPPSSGKTRLANEALDRIKAANGKHVAVFTVNFRAVPMSPGGVTWSFVEAL